MPTFRRPELALLLQGILIALPVAVLAGGALHLLHNDQTVEQEVRDNARVVVPGLARKLGGALLSRQQEAQSQGEIVDGQVKLLAGFPTLPEPDDWPRKLTGKQAQWWKIAQDVAYRQPGGSQEDARKALSGLATAAPADSSARANAELGLLELGESANRTERAVNIAERFPQAVTPSGTPVAALALLLALQHTAGALPERLMQAVETDATVHPSFLTPELLEAAQRAAAGGTYADRIAALRQRWQGEEAARERTREALRRLRDRQIPADRPGELWLEVGLDELLALTNPVRGGWDVALVPETSLVAALKEELRSTGGLPEYAGAVVEIGGRRLRVAGAPAAGADPPLLASVEGKLIANIRDDAFAPHTFRLDLDLSASYQQRRRLIQWMIFSAAGTALIGLVTVWTGHRRQARLNEMKSNFVSSVSHELRAPIAAVQLMAESLASGRVTDESRQQDYYRLIVQECRRLSTLVGNVLDFARIDQGRQSYRFEPVDPMALLRHSVMLMQPHAEQRHVRLVLFEPAEASTQPQPSWDREAVEQALVNLLDNAIKHSPEGAEVRVELEACHDAVRLWVRDRGQGIPATDHTRIFERFYRGGQELRRETKGVGIGLSIVKHVAEGHGGRVLVESVVGQGSSFALELPS